MSLQIYKTKWLDILEIALDEYITNRIDEQNVIVKAFNAKVDIDLTEKIEDATELRATIHEQNKRLKYQELRD